MECGAVYRLFDRGSARKDSAQNSLETYQISSHSGCACVLVWGRRKGGGIGYAYRHVAIDGELGLGHAALTSTCRARFCE
jgi:hypothetical protein